METKYERENVITYEVYSNIDREKKHVYASDTLHDLVKNIKQKEKEYYQEKDD
ncbi:MAG: hypothetical protein ACVCEJ_03285 [Candidatus Izemoplasmataceae bacterium]